MKGKHAVICIGPIVFAAASCGGERIPPKALVDAREDLLHAKDGIAMTLDPTDVHEADVALQRAEQAWQDSPNDPRTVDLAIIADRKALAAQGAAGTIKAQQDTQEAIARLQASKAAQLPTAQGQLNHTPHPPPPTPMHSHPHQPA